MHEIPLTNNNEGLQLVTHAARLGIQAAHIELNPAQQSAREVILSSQDPRYVSNPQEDRVESARLLALVNKYRHLNLSPELDYLPYRTHSVLEVRTQ